MSLQLVGENGEGATAGIPTPDADARAGVAANVSAELALQVETVLIRHMTQRGITKEELKDRISLCQRNWPPPKHGEDALLMRKWFCIDGTDVPYPCVQVRLTGPAVFVETVMRAGARL